MGSHGDRPTGAMYRHVVTAAGPVMSRFFAAATPVLSRFVATVTPATKWLADVTPVIAGCNEWTEFVLKLFSKVSGLLSDNSGEHRKKMLSELDRLERCMISLPGVISLGEWYIHRKSVAPLLHRLKGRMLDAIDLLEAFNYQQKALIIVKESDLDDVKEIREDIEYLEEKLGMLIDCRTPVKRFEECIRRDKGYICDESLVRGHEGQLEEVIQKLGVPLLPQLQHATAPSTSTNKRHRKGKGASRAKRTRIAASTPPQELTGNISSSIVQSDEQRTSNMSALAVVGIGGIGKTTLVQKVFNDQRVHDHFDMRIWISVSNDFDVVRLTKKFVECALEHLETGYSSSGQSILSGGGLESKKFLLVLDDVWDDMYSDHENKLHAFLQPLRCGKPGSMVLLTTRSQKVAEMVNLNDHFALEGLPDQIFAELFNDCAFGIDRSQYKQELADIGARMIPHLKGCPLAAKTLGRLLSSRLDRDSWNGILASDLWDDFEQKNDDILPVLRLSYQYLSSSERSCFSFCSMYPKGYQFDADTLVDQWVAAGLLDSLEGNPENNGHICLHNLLHGSLFQKATTPCKYVMHDLMHDMAQLVSGNQCFIIKSQADLEKIPENVRHLSILESSGLDSTNREYVSRCKKLRSLVCHGIPSDVVTPAAECWFEELTNIRSLSFISCKLEHLPKSIGNLRLLRNLDIGECTFENLPKSFWCLYNLQTVNAQNCKFQHIPEDFNGLERLRKFRLRDNLVREPGLVP